MLPKKLAPMLFGLMLSGMMSPLVSCIATWRAMGLAPGFAASWVSAWLVAWPIAFPAVLLAAPWKDWSRHRDSLSVSIRCTYPDVLCGAVANGRRLASAAG